MSAHRRQRSERRTARPGNPKKFPYVPYVVSCKSSWPDASCLLTGGNVGRLTRPRTTPKVPLRYLRFLLYCPCDVLWVHEALDAQPEQFHVEVDQQRTRQAGELEVRQSL